MFKVFRIKEEHSAFRSDGGGIGSRGLACVRPHHASLFSLSLHLSVSLFPLVIPLFSCPPPRCLYYLTLSLPSPPLFFCSLALSIRHSSYKAPRYLSSLAGAASPLISPPLIHPSIHLSPLPPHCHYPSTFIIYALFYLPPSLPPSLHLRFYLSHVSFISYGGP